MKTLITYGSCYGSAKHYAQKFADRNGFDICSYQEIKSTADYDRVIHFGALYAGGVLGLRKIVSVISEKTEFVIVTVGLADVGNTDNTENIKKSIQSQVSEEVFCRARIFHLRGAIDYGKLRLRHRAMMALLYAKVKGLPEEKKNEEVRAMIETYGKQVSFIDDAALCEIEKML